MTEKLNEQAAQLIRQSLEPSTNAAPDVAVGTHAYSQRYLFAFATQGELLQHIRTQTLSDEVARCPDLLAEWQMQQGRVQMLLQMEAGLADTCDVEALPAEVQPRIQEIAADRLLRKTFSALPITFGLVEIDKLVAPQRHVNLDYVARLQVAYENRSSVRDLVEICLAPTREMPPIQHLEVGNNTHVFSSPNLDVRFLGAFFKRLLQDDLQFAELGGIPAAAVITFVGYGGAPINVLQSGSRLVLNNGFHRVYALRSLGLEKIPVIVQRVQHWQLEFPPVVCGLPREYLLGAPRPVLMKDFFEEGFSITLRAKERMKVVTLQTGLSQFDVPA